MMPEKKESHQSIVSMQYINHESQGHEDKGKVCGLQSCTKILFR